MTSLRSGVKLTLMKKLSLYIFLVLMWCNVGFAKDISEYKIEGMTIGVSLLDYFTENEIIKNISEEEDEVREKNKFYDVNLFYLPHFETYDMVQIALKFNDKNYKIYGVDGIIHFKNRIEDCYKKQQKVNKEFSEDFEYVEKKERGTIDHPDYDGATTKDIFFLLKTGEVLMINCTDYSNKDNEAGDEDLFRIGLWTKELNEWLTNI